MALDSDAVMPCTKTMCGFIETPFFSKMLERYLDDDEYAQLQEVLNARLEAGAVAENIPGHVLKQLRAEIEDEEDV